MHELSIAQAMIEQLEEAVKKEDGNFCRIESIDLELGLMSGVERDALEFVFPIASQGTIAQDAVLHFEEIPVLVKCNKCNSSSNPEFPVIICMKCSSTDVDVVAGKDFKIKSMEVS